ncbi:MAG: helix-turn-helix domain-containing protein [Maribacter sp.]|nr:helix-turn-helix domain-containing protein [Maribacter sp.]
MHSELSMDQAFINKLTELLESNLEKEHFGVKELAKAMGVSRSQLHRKIHAINNNSTSQFIREFRLKEAMVMLQNKVATASEIAYRVGFASPTYFNTCFREYYGYTPGEVKYRNPLNKAEKKNTRILNEANPDEHSPNKIETEPIFFSKKWVVAISLVLVMVITIAYSFYIKTSDTAVNEPITLLENETTEKSIAVLPIKNWSGDPELDYIGYGMTDAVIARLTMIKSMTKVVPLTSVLKYNTSELNVPDIAKELGVQHVLQGSFQLSGDQMKITLYLIDGPVNKHSWSYEYSEEWDGNEIFKVQAEIAENVAKNMNVEIKDKELEAIQNTPTQNKEAYNYWVQAKFQASKRTKLNMENAVLLYEKAIELDSTFYEAYFNLAYLYLIGGSVWGIYNEQEAWRNTKGLLLKASQIDSTDSRVNQILNSGLMAYEWDFDHMEKQFKKNKKSGFGYAIPYLINTGRYEEALAIINRAIETNPTRGFMYAIKAEVLYLLNRNEEAKDLLKSKDKLFNDNINYLREGAKWYFYMGEYENSKALLKKIMTKFSDRPPIVLWLNAVHEGREGSIEGVSKYIGELQKKYKEEDSGSPAWFIALYYCTVKDYENAFRWLQKSYDRHEVEMVWLREEPLLTPIRNDSRYLELYANVGFPMKPHRSVE